MDAMLVGKHLSKKLDRLFVLLDTGSTPLIRKSAALQLGEVQKLHPYELNNLLTKVHVYLKSSNWDTRIAAAQAVEAIAKNVPQWEPRGAPKQESPDLSILSEGKLLFSQFDLTKVLLYGASLLGSEGETFDLEDKNNDVDDKVQLTRQRQLLNKKLGLDVAGNLGLVFENELFSDEDLLSKTQTDNSNSKGVKPVTEIVKQQLRDLGGISALSSREKNRAKRKAKAFAKQSSRDCSCESETEPPSKKIKVCDGEDVSENSCETPILEENDDWPFESFCDLLMADMFNSSWETRHGAATGLREVIKQHGRGAGKSMDTPADLMVQANQIWLGDLALRLLCVLALDRFGDFVSDEVVAPVRETCAQTLGVVCKYLDSEQVRGVMSVLLQLLAQIQWEVRHAGLLGIKYLLAVRTDMTNELLPFVTPYIFQGLQDVDDDVRAVAASAIVPVSDNLVNLLSHQIPVILTSLWNTLLDLDDLTASTNSIMTLLSTLLAHPKAPILDLLSVPLHELVPRLWPFFRHNISSVRKAALATLNTLLLVDNTQYPPSAWLPMILQDGLRHVYQRALLEPEPQILDLVEKVWTQMMIKVPLDFIVAASIPWMGVWLSLAMQPSKIPYDQTYLIEARHRGRSDQDPSKSRHQFGPNILSQSQSNDAKQQPEYIAGCETSNNSIQERDACVIRARVTAARLLGVLFSHVTKPLPNLPPEVEKPIDSIAKLINFHLSTKSAVQRLVVAEVVYHWAQQENCKCPEDLKSKLLLSLNEGIYFDEIAISFTRLQTDCRDFLASLKQQGMNMDSIVPPNTILSLDQSRMLATSVFDQVKGALKPKMLQTFEERRGQLRNSVNITIQEQQGLTIRVQSSLARALVMLNALPDKLNPVIRPLMEAIKKEENYYLQHEAGCCIAHLLKQCLTRDPCPNSKVLTNLCSALCCDPNCTPPVQINSSNASDGVITEACCNTFHGILTLNKLQKTPETGRRFCKKSSTLKMDVPGLPELSQGNSEVQKNLFVQRQGAENALTTVAHLFDDRLSNDLPTLWKIFSSPLMQEDDNLVQMDESLAQEIVHSLQVLETVCPVLHNSLLLKVIDKLPKLLTYLHCKYTAVRHMAARCLGVLSQLLPSEVMTFTIEKVLPLLEVSDNDTTRQGVSEAIANIIDHLGLTLIPYIVLLVVPVLGRMSDQNEAVRLMNTHCFATLIRLMPLEAGIPDPPEMKISLTKQKEVERKFLEQLMDGSKLESYKIEVPIKAELRKYQQDGVNWLAFLSKYKLHGILCDDMGLGKTLQSICIIANDHKLRGEQYTKTKSPNYNPLPSIVVCPPTLIGHWVYEVKKFVDSKHLNPLMYAGPPAERIKLQKKAKKHNLIVASYDVVRNDIDFFGNISWNYCVLDEGHIIKNGKTKISKAVKQLNCNHRLILSGTPIQNNVLDLWSLFDFLIPGFLGSEKQFQARYGKPILASREAKSSSKEQEAGALAMDSLHRQVLPFILRRLKEDVLQDLPPKIIQDYYCDLCPLQVQLYEDFAKSQAKKGVEDCLMQDHGSNVNVQASTHVFQALQYLKKVCNHPALVLNPSHPKYDEIMQQLKQQNSSLHDIQLAPKLTALRQLLNDCGIGLVSESSIDDTPVVNQHRVLLFCQLKSMLEIVEKDLLKACMPSVTYLRLDGSIPAGSRHDIVHRFNNDPSIDILLLTTHVGGLGLNLTGADTVIFVEHDWNPMKDLQAMDRAHRIGQKKVVNVYRLVTRGTLEEKIMGLQKFKMTIANTVISQDNSSLQTMGTDQLLELFSLEEKKKGESAATAVSDGSIPSKKESVKSILDNLGDLWDTEQYEREYSLDAFMNSLK